MLQQAAWGKRPRPVGVCPRMDPRRVVAYVPKLHAFRPLPEPKQREDFWAGPNGSGLPPAAGGGAGLVGSAQFGQRPDLLGFPPRRNGLKGITRLGLRRIRQGGQVLEEDPKCCTFWTITLADGALIHLHETDGWHRFQNAIRHELVRLLRRRRGQALVVACVELQPKRSARFHLPVPHLHVLYRSKRHRKGPWALSVAEHDRLIVLALRACGYGNINVDDAGSVEAIKRSAAGYISKYMSKSMESNGLELEEYMTCPRQWFFMSRELLRLVEALTIDLPAALVEWLIRNARPNDRGQLYQCSAVPGLPRGAPSCWVLSFRSADAAWCCLEAWETALM